MKFMLLMCGLLVFPSLVLSQGVSQIRMPEESFEQAMERNRPKDLSLRLTREETAVYKKVPLDKMDLSKVPEVPTMDALINMFQLVRDTRFLKSGSTSSFLRRISWLYPDEGCFARAAVASLKLKEEHMIRPMKIFAFGSLEASSPYALRGSVTWWYHVALVVKYMGSYYVLDPAINQKRPMLYDEWYSSMGHMRNIKGVICNAYTYQPFDSCMRPKESNEAYALSDQRFFLYDEWERVKALGFDPVKLLGSEPPWL